MSAQQQKHPDSARQQPRHQWDIEIPDDNFWNSLDYGVCRAFIGCFTDEEMRQMESQFDMSLSREEKVTLLRDIIEEALQQKEASVAPEQLSEVDRKPWVQLKMAIASMNDFLGDYEAVEKSYRELWDSEPVVNGTKNKSVLVGLSGLQETLGRYSEAEATALEALTWLQTHTGLGNDSPQALGCMRVLIKSVWKQGRQADAQGWIEEAEKQIANMREVYVKYREEERKQLEEDVKELKSSKL